MSARDRTHEARPGDAFMTIDPRVIPALLEHFRHPDAFRIWECAAGDGHMVRALQDHHYEVFASDIERHSGGKLDAIGDFLACDHLPERVFSIVTNPPNRANIAFAKKALELTEPVGGMVALYQRHEWDTTKESAAIFDHPAYAYKITCRFRPRWIETRPGEKAASPFHRWSWFVWIWASVGMPAFQRFAA